jgi:hypothetical protein
MKTLTLAQMIKQDLAPTNWYAKHPLRFGNKYQEINCHGCGSYFPRLKRIIGALKTQGRAARQFCFDCRKSGVKG